MKVIDLALATLFIIAGNFFLHRIVWDNSSDVLWAANAAGIAGFFYAFLLVKLRENYGKR